jgi:hypothetical protein
MQTLSSDSARDGGRSEDDPLEPCTEPETIDSWTQTAELLDLCELVDGEEPLDAFASEPNALRSGEVGPAPETKTNPHQSRIQKDAPTAAIARRAPRSWRPPTVGVAALVLISALFGAAYRATPGKAVDLKPAAEAPTAGRVSITTVPADAEAWIDGTARGATPLTLEVPAGAHTLELRLQGQTRTLAITVKPGVETAHYIELRGNAAVETATLLIRPGTSSETSIGWMTVTTPIVLEAFEDGRLLGTTAMDRIAVAAGRHRIEFVNDSLGFRRTQNVRVDAGRTLTLSIEVPKGVAHINALPWAEVTVDREAIGETPIGNLELSIGPHEVVLRHPLYGERRQTITVTADAPAKLGVDLRK